jgi:hypothetical protein
MATVTVLTGERMLEIEAASIVSAAIVDGVLILTKFDNTTIEVGSIVVAPDPPPTVTGSRDGNAALASLLDALETQGLIIDGTTA